MSIQKCKDLLRGCQPHLDEKIVEKKLSDAEKIFEELKKKYEEGDAEALKCKDFIEVEFVKQVEDVKEARRKYWFEREFSDDKRKSESALKDAKTNMERFPERTTQHLKKLDELLDKIKEKKTYASSEGVLFPEVAEFVENIEKEKKNVEKKFAILLARKDRTKFGLSYGLDWQLENFVRNVNEE